MVICLIVTVVVCMFEQSFADHLLTNKLATYVLLRSTYRTDDQS
jgi:hypothetical protein